MVTLMSHHQSRRERRQDDTDADGTSVTSWFPETLGVAGFATASTAITCMAISQHSHKVFGSMGRGMGSWYVSSSSAPPPAALQRGNDDDDSIGCYYLLALSGIFYAGIAELGAAVWVMAEPRGRLAARRRLVYASIVPLTTAVGLLAAATLFW